MPKKDSLNVDDAIFDKLGACSPELAPRLPRLRRLLASSDCADRRAGVDLLAECTQQNEQAAQIVFPFLVGLLEHPDEVIQECAEYGLSDLGPMSFNWILRLLGKLTEKNAAVAVHLIRALGHFKYASETKALWPAAVKQLAQLLDNDSGDVRGAAALSMVELGAKTKPFIQRLVSMSHSTHAVERARALRCLREVSDDDQKLVLQLKPVFLEALGEPDAEAREAIEYALRDCGPKIFPELTRRLSDERPTVRAHVLKTLSHFETESLSRADVREAAKRLEESLVDADKEVRKAAAFALAQGQFGNAAEAAVTRLFEMCQAAAADERSSALHALWCIGGQREGKRFPSGVDCVRQNLSHEDADVRKWAVDVHPYLELSDGEIIAALVKGVEDPNCEVAGTACKALCDLAKKEFDVSAAMPALVRLLDRRECDRIHGVYLAFEHACEILAMLPEKQAKAAVEPLCRSLSSGSPKVVTSAAEALWKIDKQVDASLPRLKELLDDGELLPESFCDVLFQIGPAASSLMGDVLKLLAKGDWDTQWAAADALGSMASTDPACVSALIAALQHPSGIVRGAAIQALSKIGKDAVRPLIQTLREGDDEQKEMAADALGVIGSEAEEAVSDLMSLMKSSEEGVRDWSAIALGKIAGCEAAVPTLTTILRLREGPNIRAQASEALGNIGPKARAALSLLQAALRDDDENVQSAAADAIMKIDEGS